MKNKNVVKILSLSFLVLTVIIFAVGAYAANSTNLLTSGKLGFISHNCDISLYGKITGAITDPKLSDADSKELYLVNYSGSGPFSSTSDFNFNDAKELSFEHDLWDSSSANPTQVPKIYFDSTKDVVNDIVITLYLKNNSSYPVYVQIADLTLPANTTYSTSGSTILSPKMSNYSEYSITLKIDSDLGKVEPTDNFYMSFDFSNRTAVAAPENVVVDPVAKTVSFDPVDGATGYEITYYEYSKLDEIAALQTTTLHSNIPLDADLPEYSSYVIKVRAYLVEEEETVYSDYVQAKEKIENELPVPKVTEVDGGYLTISFEKIDDTATYEIAYYRKDETTGAPIFTQPTAENDKVELDFTSLGTGKYVVKVRAVKEVDGKILYSDYSDASQTLAYYIPTPAKYFEFSDERVVGLSTTIDNLELNKLTEIVIPRSYAKDKYGNIIDGDEIEVTGIGIGSNSSSSPNFKRFYGNSIVLLNNITSISSYTFYNCNTITEITIPVSLKESNYDAFYGCNSLTNVYYTGRIDQWCNINFRNDFANPCCNEAKLYVDYEPVTTLNLDTTTKTSNYSFDGCISLETVNISNDVKSIASYAFKNCKSIKTIDFPDNSIKIGEYAFYGSGLQELTLPKSITTVESYAFSRCTSLTKVNFLGDVTEIKNDAFSYCSMLLYINLPKSLKTLGADAFEYSGLIEVTIPEKLTSLSSAFRECDSLVRVTLTENVIEIGSYAFYGCGALTNITIPKNVVTIKENAFSSCSLLKEVYYEGSVAQWCKINFDSSGANPCCNGATLYIDDTAITSMTFTDYVEIGQYIFDGCTSLKTITLPDSVISIGKYAFSGTSIMQVAIPPKMTRIESGTFSNCKLLTNIQFTENIIEIGSSAFSGCSMLSQVNIPRSIQTINGQAFYSCGNLNNVFYAGSLEDWCNIDFSGSNPNPCYNGASLYVEGTQKITSINFADLPGYTKIKPYILQGCKDIDSITIPDTVESIGQYAFSKTIIEEIALPKNITTIEPGLFYGCSKLSNIIFNGKITIIGNSAFDSCSSLKQIIIPGTVTTIDSSAFDSCSSLTQIIVPKSVNSIGSSAFYNCYNLSRVYYTGDMSQFGKLSSSIGSYNTNFTNATTYYLISGPEQIEDAPEHWWYYDPADDTGYVIIDNTLGSHNFKEVE